MTHDDDARVAEVVGPPGLTETVTFPVPLP